MTLTDPSRDRPPRRLVGRSAGLVAAAALVAGAFLTRSADAAEPNPLDIAILDVAVLAPATADGPPRLLTVAPPDAFGTVLLTILERDDGAWAGVSTLALAGGQADGGGSPTPILIPASPTDFGLLLGPADQEQPTIDTLVRLRVTGDSLEEIWRAQVPGPTTASGVADVDADGAPDFVLAESASMATDGCAGTAIRVIPVATGTSTTTIHEERLIMGAAIGRWDMTPGDDLLFYAQDGCQSVGADLPAMLAATRLRDGVAIRAGISLPTQPLAFGAPLRFELDANSEVDEALIRGSDGLAILDPGLGWMISRVAGSATLPLAAVSAPRDGGLARVAWMDFERDAVATSVAVGRSRSGVVTVGSPSSLAVSEVAQTRATPIAQQAASLLGTGDPVVALAGEVRADRCHDLVLPGAWMPCGSEALEGSSAWIGTRPLAILDVDGDRRLLVASTGTFDRDTGLPLSPTPAATPLDGWWRIGASEPFTLAEVDVDGALRVPPSPRSAIDPVLAPDGTTEIASVAGARLLVRVSGSEDEDGVPPPITPGQILGAAGPTLGARGMTRIPVPPGGGAADDDGSIRLPVHRVGSLTRPSGWAIHVVALDDRGELGVVVSTHLSIDTTGPMLAIEAPFTTAVWPFPARLAGTAEPGSMVDVPGVGQLRAGRGGSFEFETTLAPWPQTYVLTASDAAGNRTSVELSVVGGLDYRRLPWIGIVIVMIIGVAGVSAARGGRRRPVMAIDPATWPQPEIEELPVEGRSDPP